MKREWDALRWLLVIVVGIAIAMVGGSAFAGPFSQGTLVVERLGNGSTTLTGSAAAIAVLEVTTSGSLAQTISLDTSGPGQQTDSGSANSNGYLNTHAGFVAVPGYDAAVGTASVASGTTIARVTSTLGAAGSVASRTVFPTGIGTPFYNNNFRSSIATSGSTFYAAGTGSGGTGGVWHYDGSAFTQVSSTAATVSVTNLRNVEIYANQLYFSSSSGTFLGISALGSGLPTTGPLLPSLTINMGAGASPYGFVMFSTGSQGPGVLDLAYIADDRNVTGGGLQKWTYDGSAWSNAWSLLVSSTSNGLFPTTTAGAAGLRGLTGTWNAVSGAALYATTASPTNNNALISILDAGVTPSTYTTLLASGSNFVFRGVDVSPVAVPEPSGVVLLLAGGACAGLVARQRRNTGRVGAGAG